ncbi:MAG TPA: type II secretion system protein GspM [Nitrospiraceae bacterium]|jgi:general secretion pathway protein M|nr:type II secretion system protein GspM [Nitrospiraceae bacterium]
MTQALAQRWKALAQRERVVVGAGAAVIGAALVFVAAVDPLLERLDRLERQAARKQREIREVAALGAEYAALQARLSRLEDRLPPPGAQFSLVAFVEEVASQTRVRERIVGMQPQPPTATHSYQETSVDLRLDGVSFSDLLALLVELEQAPYGVQVRHLKLKPKYDAPHLLEANLRVVSYDRPR